MACVPHTDRVWVQDPKDVWTICTVSDYASRISERRGREAEPTPPRPVREDEEEGLDDVCSLSSVWEGSVLHTLRKRYLRDKIYTRVTQDILISLNPFPKDLRDLYSEETQGAYREGDDCSNMPPHLYGLVKDASQRLRHDEKRKNQAIVIGGESGAGKTVSGNHVLSFLVGQGPAGTGTTLDHRIVQSSVILEAFGNAVTVRNHNSSRFGKWLDVKVSWKSGWMHTHGCELTHYLLEATRVCKHSLKERGYHIFYRLLHDTVASKKVGLEGGAEKYTYLSPMLTDSDVPLDDVDGLEKVKNAFKTFKLDEKEEDIFRVLAFILSLGNCEFEESVPGEAQLTEKGGKWLRRAADMLKPSKDKAKAEAMLTDFLTKKERRAGKHVDIEPVTRMAAEALRDDLARILYSDLFGWLVDHMNVNMLAEFDPPEGTLKFGVLDFPGFEDFPTNSLEQLLINLSNEYLQECFNDKVFRAEEKECVEENITPAASQDERSYNLECLKLIAGESYLPLDWRVASSSAVSKKQPMILDALSDISGMSLVAEKERDNAFFRLLRGLGVDAREKEQTFKVKHFAGEIVYKYDGWVTKNSVARSEAVVKFLEGDEFMNNFVKGLGKRRTQASTQACPCAAGCTVGLAPRPRDQVKKPANKKRFLVDSFRADLYKLVGTLRDSDVQFVRCIKPSERNDAERFDAVKVMKQLRQNGVLEAVRIRQSGFPSRWPFQEFVALFRCITAVEEATFPEPRDAAEAVVADLMDREMQRKGGLRLGKTKVFGTSSATAKIEQRRIQKLNDLDRQIRQEEDERRRKEEEEDRRRQDVDRRRRDEEGGEAATDPVATLARPSESPSPSAPSLPAASSSSPGTSTAPPGRDPRPKPLAPENEFLERAEKAKLKKVIMDAARKGSHRQLTDAIKRGRDIGLSAEFIELAEVTSSRLREQLQDHTNVVGLCFITFLVGIVFGFSIGRETVLTFGSISVHANLYLLPFYVTFLIEGACGEAPPPPAFWTRLFPQLLRCPRTLHFASRGTVADL